MALQLDVYDITNTGEKLGTVAKAHGIAFTADVRVPGMLTFDVDVAASTDRALLQKNRVIRINDGTTDLEAYRIQDTPSELAVDDERPFVSYDCRHLLTDLGYSIAGAVLRPYGGLTGLQQSPRWFGPMGFDFPDVVRPEPTTDGPLTRKNWQDPRAERFVFSERALYRRVLTGSPDDISPARMWLTAAAWTEVRVWLDGAEVPELSSEVGRYDILMWDFAYDGEDHVIFFDCQGTPPAGAQNSLGWTWAKLTADSVGEYNDWGQMEGRLFTTFNSTTYTGPTPPSEPFWQAWEDYLDADYPGVTVGRVMSTAVDEAQARGLLAGKTYDFTEALDSDGVAWAHEFARAFRPQLLGQLADSLDGFGCEPHMTPANVLQVFQERGTDRTATITITSPASLSPTGKGVQATRYLGETDGGFFEVTDTAAETALGLALEDYVTLGEDMHPWTVEEAILLQLAEDSDPPDEIEIELPADVVPYDNAFLGDRVFAQTDADGTEGTVRIMSFRGEVLDNRTNWTARVKTT